MSTFINLLEVVYPVGTVYQSFNSNSPAAMFGGTWEQIEDQFLYNTATSGSTGGSKVHDHHWFLGWLEWYGTHPSMDNLNSTTCFNSNTEPYGGGEGTEYTIQRKKAQSKWGHSKAASLSSGTASKPASAMMECATTETSTMPPYITCYCWRRTA